MLKDFDQFLNEGVHAKVRELTNAKVIDAIDTKLLCYGIDLHYCKFEPSDFHNEVSLLDLGEISIIVDTKRKETTTYLVINIETPYIFKISPDGVSQRLDSDVKLKGYVFNLVTYGYDSRDSAIIRDRKNLDKDSEPENYLNYDNVDLVQTEKNINQLINKLNKFNLNGLILSLSEILDGTKDVTSASIKELENYQKKALNLCNYLENCKQAFITLKNMR